MKLRAISENFTHDPIGEYQAEEVPLADGIYGTVRYEYEVKKSGDYLRASRLEPASYPSLEVSKLHTVEILAAVDEMGNPAPILPEYEKVAANYFWKRLADTVLDR